MEHAWFIDGEFAFDCRSFYFAYAGDTAGMQSADAISELDAIRGHLWRNSVNGETTGLMIVERNATIGVLPTVSMMGTLGMVPDGVKHVILVNATHIGSNDVREMLFDAFRDNVLLLDAIGNHPNAIYTSDDMEPVCDDDTDCDYWSVHALPGASVRAGKVFDILSRFSEIHVLDSMLWLSPYTGLPHLLGGCEEIARERGKSDKKYIAENMANHYMGAIWRAKSVAQALSFGRLDCLRNYEDVTESDLERDILYLAEHVSRGTLMSRRSSAYAWGKWSIENNWSWDCERYDGDESDNIEKIYDIDLLWNDVWLGTDGAKLLPDETHGGYARRERGAKDFAALQRLGREMGIDAVVDSYLKGVPIEDILA